MTLFHFAFQVLLVSLRLRSGTGRRPAGQRPNSPNFSESIALEELTAIWSLHWFCVPSNKRIEFGWLRDLCGRSESPVAGKQFETRTRCTMSVFDILSG